MHSVCGKKKISMLQKKVLLALAIAGTASLFSLQNQAFALNYDDPSHFATGVAATYGVGELSNSEWPSNVVGGWGLYVDETGAYGQSSRYMDKQNPLSQAEDFLVKPTANTNVTITGGTVANTVGGHQVYVLDTAYSRYVDGDKEVPTDPGRSQIPSHLSASIGNTQVTVKNGNFNSPVVGGSYIMADDNFTGQVDSTVKTTTVTVEGGDLGNGVIAGSVAQRFHDYTPQGTITVEDNTTNLILRGGMISDHLTPDEVKKSNQMYGSFSPNFVFGGGAAMGGGTTSHVQNVNITVDGIGDNRHYFRIYGGGFAQAGGTTEVENSTITIKHVTNAALIAGGYVIAGPLMVQTGVVGDGENPLDKVRPLVENDFSNIYGVEGSLTTTARVGKSTINMEGGQLWQIWLGSESPSSENMYSAYNPNVNKVLTVDEVVLNYKGGEIGEITMPASTKKATINLGTDLKVGDYIQALGEPNQMAPLFEGGILPQLTVNGQNLYGVTGNVYVNVKDGEAQNLAPGSRQRVVALQNLTSYKGNIISGYSGSIDLENVKAIEGELQGPGSITLDSMMTLTDKTVFNGDDISIIGGEYSGVYRLEKNVGLHGGKVTVNNFAKDMLGEGKFILTDDGVLLTTATQLFGERAGDATVTRDGEKILPREVDAIANSKVEFRNGEVILNEKTYSLTYAKAASTALQAADGGNHTKLTITGAVEGITLNDLQTEGVGNIRFEGATIDGTNSNPNLIIGTLPVSDPSDEVAGVTTEATQLTTGFTAGALDLATDSKGLIITGGQTLGLGGTTGEQIVTVDGKPSNVTIAVGTSGPDADHKGTLNIGSQAVKGQYTLAGSAIINRQGTMATRGDVKITEGLTLAGGTVQAQNGVLKTAAEVVGGLTSKISGNVEFSKLSLENETATLQVGDADTSANVILKGVTLNGGVLILDPAWDKEAANVAVDFTKSAEESTANYIDGKLLAGQNTYATIGTDLLAQKAFEEAKKNTELQFGENSISSALYIQGNQTLGNQGAVYVNGALNDNQLGEQAESLEVGTFSVADDSLTMVEGSATMTKAALSGVQKAVIGENAKLYIQDAKGKQVYHILSNNGREAIVGIQDSHWSDNNLYTNKRLVTLTGKVSDQAFDVEAISHSVKDIYGDKVIIGDVADKGMSNDEAMSFQTLLNRMTDETLQKTEAAQVDALNSVGQMTALGGVTHGAYTMTNFLADSVENHVSLENEVSHDRDVWAKLIHTKENVSGLGMDGVNGSYDSKYNGIVVGADLYHQGNRTLGAALTYVDGSVNSHSLVTATSTDTKYYGLGLYGRVDKGSYTFLGDVTYLHGTHDLTQYNTGVKVTGSTHTDAFSVGIRGEKQYLYGEGAKFIPYVGLRYVHLTTGDYTDSLGLMHSQGAQNMFLLPLGVKYVASHKHGDWIIKPAVELGYVWNLGSRSVDQVISLDGTANGFSYDVADRGSFIGRLGVEAAKGDITYGLQYEYQKGSSVKSNRIAGTVNIKF